MGLWFFMIPKIFHTSQLSNFWGRPGTRIPGSRTLKHIYFTVLKFHLEESVQTNLDVQKYNGVQITAPVLEY